MTNKTKKELDEYAKEFWTRYAEMENGERYVERIEKGEAEIEKLKDIEVAIFNKFMKNKGKNKHFTVDGIEICYPNDEINGCKGKRNKKNVSKL